MMMDTEENDNKDTQAGEQEGGRGGHTICTNCYDDGTYDVFNHPLIPASEKEYPDGIFGLESQEDAFKAQIALQKQGPDYASSQDADMMQGFGAGKPSDDQEMGGNG